MLLSECMRLGAMLGPQIKHFLIDGNGGSCAVGACFLAVGEKTYSGMERIFPQLRRFGPLWREIASRNNRGWTREQIADWLVESGNDCESITVAPAQDIAAALVPAHMVAK